MDKQFIKTVTPAVKRIFDTEDGKILMEYLDTIYYNQLSFDAESPYKTAFNEGARDVIHDLKRRKSYG